MKTCTATLLFLLCSWAWTPGLAQELPFAHYTVDSDVNPLPSSSVSEVYQDRLGYLWFVVYSSGLVRYDGHNMVVYTTEHGLSSNTTIGITEDKIGRLWVPTRKGLSVSTKPLDEYAAGETVKFTTELGGQKLTQLGITSDTVETDNDGNLWAGTAEGLFFYRYIDRDKVEESKIKIDLDGVGQSIMVTAVKARRTGGVWVALADGRVVTLESADSKWQTIEPRLEKKCSRVTSLFEHPNGSLYGGCDSGATWQLRAGEKDFSNIKWLLDEKGSKVNSISLSQDGHVWVATRGSGFFRLGITDSDPVKPFNRTNGLLSDLAQHVFEDPEGNLWFSQSGGVSKLRFNSRAFLNWTATSHAGEKPTLPSPGVRTVRHLKQEGGHSLWVGTGSGLVAVSPAGIKQTLTAADGFKTNDIWLLCSDPAGRQWVNDSAGINAISFSKEMIPAGMGPAREFSLWGEKAYINRAAWYRSRSCVSVSHKENGRVRDAVCFSGRGEMKCWSEGKWLQVGEKQGIPNSKIQAMAVGPEGRLWLGTGDQGLFRTKVTFGKWLSRQFVRKAKSGKRVEEGDLLEQVMDESRGSPTNSIQSLVWFGNKLWAGTARALLELSGEPMTLAKVVGTDNGLPNQSVFSMAISPTTGSLWLGTNQGIAELSPDTSEVVRTVSRQDGLLDNEVWWHQSMHVNHEGTVHYGTSKGLAVFSPNANRSNPVAPNPKFRFLEFSQDNSGNNELTVRFAALSFADESSVRYRTRVLGYRDDWSEERPSNEVRLMNLPAFGIPRDYAFEVLASNNDGVWSDTPLRYTFTVTPAWWLRWQTITFVLLSIVGFFALFYSVRVRSIAQRAQELRVLSNNLQKEVQIRTQAQSELESALDVAREASKLKSEFLANISHELRTPLNAIVNVPGPLIKDYVTVRVWQCSSCEGAFQDDVDPSSPVPEEPEVCPECHIGMACGEQTVCVGDLGEHRHFLRRIETSGRHLLAVVNDLLNFSKLEAGKMNLVFSEIDVGKIFEDLSHTMALLAEDKGVKLRFPESTADVSLVADALKVTQVLVNLIGNAIKFTAEGGDITIGLEPVDDEGQRMYKFSVKDTGIGIPPEQCELVFESFRQVDGSHTRAHQGTGLGLAITKQLVELHGGRIWVESEVGVGSTFAFILPQEGIVKLEDESGEVKLAAHSD
ncbi:MAG: hypothetical protein HOK28_16880 [Deltaproteobacteria bacterium]|nr:hypothetical protein [Deltaproteobacteria bacterium]